VATQLGKLEARLVSEWIYSPRVQELHWMLRASDPTFEHSVEELP
jgi:hypothetical protein